MDGSMLQPLVLVALAGAMLITLYEMGTALRPSTCSECPHCIAAAEARAREQERLAREYERRMGLPEDDDDRRID